MSEQVIASALSKASMMYSTGSVHQAWGIHEKLYQRFPGSWAVVRALAASSEQQGKFTRAVRLLRSMLKVGIDSQVYSEIGLLYSRCGFYWRALLCFKRATKSPSLSDYLSRLIFNQSN